ncbi:MAG: hypothetical protein RL514_104 [Verrucomicrobiota bacterium]|jgi:hypothetical protein
MRAHCSFLALSLVGLLAPLVLGLNLITPVMNRFESGDFLTVQEGRVRAYAQTLDQPKALFIGGSSTFMSIDPGVYAAALGRPVVNYGLSVNSGAEYIAKQAGDLIRPGDLVVFAAEFVFFGAGALPSPDQSANIQKRMARLLPPPPWWDMSRATAHSGKLLAQMENPVRAVMHQSVGGLHHPLQPRQSHYEPFLLTAQGWLPHTRPGRFEDKRFVWHARPNASEVKIVKSPGGRALELLVRVCAERSATLAVMPPARVVKPENRHDIVQDIERDWLNHARELGAVVLLESGATTLDLEFGFDSDYHMNDAGAEIIRQRLVPVLRRTLAEIKYQ